MPLTTKKRRSRMRTAMRVGLGLLTLAIFAAVIAGLMFWYIRANRVTATTIFHVKVVSPAILANDASLRLDERNYERFKKSQAAAVYSYYVLTAAVRDPEIASLPVFASTDKPEEWLEEHLEVEYPEDGQYLSISLSGPESQSDDLVLIIDAVAKAYQNEVIYKEKQRQLELRDLLASKLEKVNKDIATKVAEAFEIARSTRSGSGQVLDLPGVIRLDEMDPELLQPKKEPLDSETATGLESFDIEKEHIDQFRKQLDKIERIEVSPSQQVVALNERRRDLVVLEKLAVELSEKLERMDIEVGMPPRIELAQKALIEE